MLPQLLEISLIFVGQDPSKLRVLQSGGHFCITKNYMSLNTNSSSFVKLCGRCILSGGDATSKGVKIDSLGQKTIFLLLCMKHKYTNSERTDI